IAIVHCRPCLAQSIDTKAILDVPDPCPETSQPREFGLTPRLRVAQLTESCAMARPLEDQPNRRSNAITVVGFPTYAMMLHGRGHCRRLTRSAPKPPDACDGSIWPVPAFVHMRTPKRLLCSSTAQERSVRAKLQRRKPASSCAR